jgi:hypothetical protein
MKKIKENLNKIRQRNALEWFEASEGFCEKLTKGIIAGSIIFILAHSLVWISR